MRRLVPLLALLGLSFLAAGCASDDDGAGSSGPLGSGVPSTDAGAMQPVIVDLAVPPEPATGVERAQDEVMRALGSHGTLTRRLTVTAQMAVSVDDEGRRILGRLPLVARVHEDSADGTTGASAGTAPQSRPSAAIATDTSAVPRTTTAAAPAAPTTSTTSPRVPPPAASSAREPVIVDLAVPAQPQSGVEAAQDEVIGALGDHGTLTRRLTATAQMSVSVDAEGRRILNGHPLVARVHGDTADSTTN